MGDINVFKRYEIKYLITDEQRERIYDYLSSYMEIDKYKKTTIRNIYFDTDNYSIIRQSIEKPVYKEKLRIRSYGQASLNGKIFVELKKKYEDVVYKRRLSMKYGAALEWLTSTDGCQPDSQIAQEIEYFRHFHDGLKAKTFLSYEREAYLMKDGSDFRVTFDNNIMGRSERLSLCEDAEGKRIIPEGTSLMELKISQGMPVWMADYLSKERLFKSSFSKYGAYYEEYVRDSLIANSTLSSNCVFVKTKDNKNSFIRKNSINSFV